LTIILSFTIILSSRTSGQTNIYGVVKDFQTSEPIPFVNFLCDNKLILITNDKGQFNLIAPDSFQGKELNLSCVGFQGQLIKFDSLNKSDSNIILLTEQTIELEEVYIESPRTTKFKTINVGSRKKKISGNYFLIAGSSVALYFPNDPKYVGLIKKVGFYITDKGKPNSKFRIRIYGADKSFLPTTQILKHNLIVNDSSNGNKWFDIDIEKYKIKIPEYGFFVAMEWLPDSKDNVYSLKINDSNNETTSITYNGQVLGGTSEFNKDLTWYINANGSYSKNQRPADINFLNYFNPMIRALLQVSDNKKK
jgi:hypothetical protein